MTRATVEATRSWGVRAYASLNPIMIDGTGMCGGCRVTVGGKVRFACVEGPEFDAYQVDFAELALRLGAYRSQERPALERHHCQGHASPSLDNHTLRFNNSSVLSTMAVQASGMKKSRVYSREGS